MLNRGLYKAQAKEFLRTHFWQAFLVCLVFSLLFGVISISVKVDEDGYDDMFLIFDRSELNLPEQNYYTIGPKDSDVGYLLIESPISSNNVLRIALNPMVLIILSSIAIVVILWRTFVSEVLSVGQARYFLEGFKGPGSFGTLFSPYRTREWLSFAGKMFVKNLYLFFWSLLLFFPVIVKSYAYRMVPYILAEEPTLPISEAIRRSNSMTREIKFEMFVMDLSFLGWYLLGLIPFGLGTFFVIPYHRATIGKLYVSLAQDSISDSPFVSH